MRSIPRWFSIVLLAVCLGSTAIAQCPLMSSSGGPQGELSGAGRCSTLWDPDGAGPLPLRFVVGGSSLMAGDELGHRVMTWDGAQWEALGPAPGTTGDVRALIDWNGALVAAGDFTGGGLTRIAQWNGTAWQPLGAGFPASVYALTVWNGNLVAAGYLQSSGTLTPFIRTWNGSAWTSLPSPPQLDAPLALASYQGLLCVGGRKSSSGVGVFERWNGSVWSASITAQDWITSLVVRSTLVIGGTDTLFVGGFFTNIGGTAASYVASTSGGSSFTWNAVSGGLPSGCRGLHVRNTSAAAFRLVALLNDPTTPVMQLAGGFGTTSWTTMGTTLLDSVSYYNGAYHAANSAAIPTAGLRWDGAAWVPLRGPGVNGTVYAATRSGDDVIVGGAFTSIAGVSTLRIARWDGTTFTAFGTGATGAPVSSVETLVTLRNGDVIAGGLFTTMDGVPAQSIARWNGTAWSSFGAGVDNYVQAVCEMPNGDIVAGGFFTTAGGAPCTRIARWNGTSWSPLGSGMNAPVFALAVRSDGMLFAGGSFTTAGGVACNRIAQWNGTSWSPLGTGCNDNVLDVAVRPNDDVVAVGAFTNAGGVAADRCAIWTGSAWATMGASSANTGVVRAVLALPDGDIVVGHGFHTPIATPEEGLARWDGSTWSGLVTLSGADQQEPVAVHCLTQTATGDLVVGGDFRRAGGVVSRNLTKVRSTCMPLVSSFGAGCSSAAGPLVLTADTLPWLGAAFRTKTTGVAPLSLCFAVTGFAQVSVPLAAVLPEGQPGCSLLVSPDALATVQPDATGTVRASFALPNNSSLLGASFFQQTVPLEFNVALALVAVRASNGIAPTIGTL